MKDFGFTENTTNTTNTTQYPFKGTVANCNLVNFRKTASKKAEVLSILGEGCTVTVIGPAKDGFFPVEYDKKSGYIAENYIDTKVK